MKAAGCILSGDDFWDSAVSAWSRWLEQAIMEQEDHDALD